MFIIHWRLKSHSTFINKFWCILSVWHVTYIIYSMVIWNGYKPLKLSLHIFPYFLAQKILIIVLMFVLIFSQKLLQKLWFFCFLMILLWTCSEFNHALPGFCIVHNWQVRNKSRNIIGPCMRREQVCLFVSHFYKL